METASTILSKLETGIKSVHEWPISNKVVVGFNGFDSTSKGVKSLSAILGNLGIPTACIRGGEFISVDSDKDIIALVDWANVADAEIIWDRLLHEVIKPSGRKNYNFYFNLGDPSKKNAHEIDDILDLISDFSCYGSVTLGLTTNEALTIWSALTGMSRNGPVEEAGKFIHFAMNIDHVLIHGVDRTILFTKKESVEFRGRPAHQRKTQNGDDNMSAGFILGQLAGFNIRESIILAMAASGAYIRKRKSVNLADLRKYIKAWREELKANPETDVQMKPILFSTPVLH